MILNTDEISPLLTYRNRSLSCSTPCCPSTFLHPGVAAVNYSLPFPSADGPLVLFDHAFQLIRAAFGPDDAPVEIHLILHPQPRITIDTAQGRQCVVSVAAAEPDATPLDLSPNA